MNRKQLFLISLLGLSVLAACSPETNGGQTALPTVTAAISEQPTVVTVTTEAPATVAPTETPLIPTPFAESVLNPFHHILGETPAPEGWQVEPCDGVAAALCIFNGEAVVGFVEMLTFPLTNQTTLLDMMAENGLTPGSIDTNSKAYRDAVVPILELFAADQMASAQADRQGTYGDSWRFEALETEPAEFGHLPGLVYGFVSLDENDVVIERYITFVTFDAENIYLIVATSDPSAVPNFTSDADLVTFEPYFKEIVAGLDFPSPILGETGS